MASVAGVKLRAVGVNGLVRLAKLVEAAPKETRFRFREINRQYKVTLMARYLRALKESTDEKGSKMRPRGHQKIKNSLYIQAGGLGRGVSAFQVHVAGVAGKFAGIYDHGGIIHPSRGRWLAVPTVQLQNLSVNLSGKSPREVLSLLQSQGVKTTTIKANRGAVSNDYQLGGVGFYNAQSGGNASFTGKLIIGKFYRSSVGRTQPAGYKQVGLYALIHEIKVPASWWLRDGTERFVTEDAVPLMSRAAREAAEKISKMVA